ncbi:bifunctional dTDP-4-dehydrorhamnose 3,5-epimerase family protein/NAD(P)-dependent oxidoreductase [Rathayibacter sp. YIM 133350]|uniref:bifunctional dTDP-4-dehydrorhamnose 3,5-epimerase family protein/NAD(P)-dependent oxidoreductase n=1 Tax=Rathayibacter sp. YIM 133350 TaxID=3131992 RepID=UPI00307D8A8E
MAAEAKKLALRETPIPGLLVLDLPVHADERGWFRESWQRQKMLEVGLPDFGPVQNNVSYNVSTGTTRGIHAEPWDKLVSVVTGSVFGAWVDLREGPSFGTVFTTLIDPSVSVFVPRGVGNSYQSLEENTSYSYLVNDHWSAEAGAEYTFVNLGDPALGIEWPIPLDEAIISAKDAAHPVLDDVVPMRPRRTLVVGANGQLGRALRTVVPEAEFADRTELDICEPNLATARRWRDYEVIINAAAYTKVDVAESEEGRKQAWRVNVSAVAALTRVAHENNITLVHISSDYVFDGTNLESDELAPVSPLGVYGATKAAGDAIVSVLPRHYILRSSWVIGDGANFVRTMADLAARGVDPAVVDDQIGRLTFASEIGRAIRHLLDVGAPYGTYNVTSGGRPLSWAEVARRVFELTGHDPRRVTGVSTAEYFAGKPDAAPRPLNSVLSLERIRQTGFEPADLDVALDEYVERLA